MRRFDDDLMRPPTPGPVDPDLLRSVRAWCEPGASARLAPRFAVAGIAPHPGLDAVACELDGSHALARLGRWQGLWWRLQIALRSGRADDPWDAGWWREGGLSTAKAFSPRRPTLLMVNDDGRADIAGLIETVAAASIDYRRPLRLLIVSTSETTATPTPRRP